MSCLIVWSGFTRPELEAGARTLINASTRAKNSVFPVRESGGLLLYITFALREGHDTNLSIHMTQDKTLVRVPTHADMSVKDEVLLSRHLSSKNCHKSQSIWPPLDYATLTSPCKQSLTYKTATMRRRNLGLVGLFWSGALSSAFVFPVKPLGASRHVMEQQKHHTVSLIITRQP